MMLSFTPEQVELGRMMRSFLETMSPEATVRTLMETVRGFDPAVWTKMGSELGLQQLAIPEEYGGAGYTFVELGVVLEEMGRALLCAPFLSTVVLAANTLLLSSDDQAKKELLPALASGEKTGTLAYTEADGRWDVAGVSTTASESSGGGWTLNGEKVFVLDGHTADLLLVTARTANGVSIFAVDGAAAGLLRVPMQTLDLTRKQARITFSDVPARLVGADDEASIVVPAVLDLAAIALAAEAVGGAARCLDMAVEYAKVREQFGRPIGSFQAIKHKCADLLLEVESARSAAYYAMWAAAGNTAELPAAAAMAKAYCTEAYAHAAAENIQIHGGIGFTWEHPAHLYFRRAKSTELLLGDPAYHRELLVQRAGL
ncbi:acyl-CoA/acyl-ACP dehydrogenase [Mycobacterium sp. CVI_P3]|uniref:Acyl-CoA/acyl-ACP dehydrogenase n=1 Tax=Mycobacterium pinniadriaticum TaxID=2994102 RepID=A0ABT3SFA2_9MYCO|nr:acyl-CoA dehydrogenase family protein [Mycobacterium pinniadriaticum]MCX2931739.1 acyl-CoA/acyl-ACP dehydrogenase [Mycobacterium pinniadriaticum]MCX2938186.1 acyl-CoA/acyl-ACP dehydrogenase [Mycobacterium pinniadriaticum]